MVAAREVARVEAAKEEVRAVVVETVAVAVVVVGGGNGGGDCGDGGGCPDRCGGGQFGGNGRGSEEYQDVDESDGMQRVWGR